MKSLKGKVIFFFSALTIFQILALFTLNSVYQKKKNNIEGIARDIERNYVLLFKGFEYRSSFFTFDLKNPSFYEDNQSENIEQHNSYVEHVLNNLSTIQLNPYINLDTHPDSLKVFIEDYSNTFNNIVTLLKEKGFKDYGLTGAMRNQVHKLENYPQIDQTKVLSLRRHEKDYLLRNQEQYKTKLNNLADKFKVEISSSPNLAQGVKDSTLNALIKYQDYFNQIVMLTNYIGLNTNSGIKQKLDEQAKIIDTEYNNMVRLTELRVQQNFTRIRFIYILIQLLVVVISLMITIIVVNRITYPLSRLKQHIALIIEHNFKIPKELKLKNLDRELKEIYTSFKEMLIQLHQRESQRDLAQEALKINEKKYREMANMLPQSIFETDANGKYTYVNSNWFERTSYTNQDIFNGIQLFDTIGEINKACKKSVLITEQENLEISLLTKNGDYIPCLLTTNLIVKGGQNIGIRGVMVDITDRKKYIEVLKNEKQKAEQLDKLKSAFLANMSHEIRTPMNAILGFAELLSIKELEKKEQYEYIQLIRTSGELLLNLINDIIDIAKIEAGELQIHIDTCPVNKLMQELNSTFKGLLKRYQKADSIQFITNIAFDDDFSVETDVMRLKQVITNLVSNAIKFTRSGKIELGYNILQDELMFYVRDTGIGLTEGQQKIIFERFRQADTDFLNNHGGGAGLGLSITKNLVELMGGNIWLTSEINEGSCFYFTLPFKELKLEKLKPKKPTSQQTHLDLTNKKILVAEDNYSNYRLIYETLRGSNALLTRVNNGKDAVIQASNNNSFDLVLMDIQMPKLSGFEATRQIRQRNIQVPILMQSAFVIPGIMEKIQQIGANDYISKPIDPLLLMQKIQELLFQHHKVHL